MTPKQDIKKAVDEALEALRAWPGHGRIIVDSHLDIVEQRLEEILEYLEDVDEESAS